MPEKFSPEGGDKSEKIIGKIEDLASKEEISPEEAFPKGVSPEEVLKFSPEEKSEQLWACWSEYRREKYETLLEERQKPRLERKKLEEIEEAPRLAQLKNKIAELWQDKAVQGLFKKNLKENLMEREKIEPDLGSYRQKEKELERSEKENEILLRELFARREEEPGELTQIRIAELSAKIEALKGNTERVFQENPELASFIQYERLRDYHRQFEKDGFIWVPSRENLFEEILAHLVLLNKNRPMLLVGETGTGKTRLIRAAVERLTGRPAFEVGEEAKSDIRPLLGSAWMEKDRAYINYGPLGQALTGKKTSLDKESDGGGVFYMDEMNGYPADALRSLLKQIAGRAPGEEVTFAAWRGIREKIAEKSGLIGAANLPDEERGRHLDRPPLPVELTRELTTLEVDYPEQIELYEMALASLMDRNGRVRLKEGEIEPGWKETIDPKTKEKTRVLDMDPKSGGTLWRFIDLVSGIQKSYKGEQNVLTPTKADASHLETAVLDPGVALSWLREFRVSRQRKGEELRGFLRDKLKKWSAQKTHPKEDRSLLKEFCAAYGLPIEGPDAEKSDVKGRKIWSEKEIGFLSPSVPRKKEKVEAPKPVSKVAFLEDGTEIEYLPAKEIEEIGGKVLEGKTSDGKIVLRERTSGIIQALELEEFEAFQRESYLGAIRERLESALKGKKPEEFNKIRDRLIDSLMLGIGEREKREKYRRDIEKDLKKLSDQDKIEYILSKF